MKKLLRLSCKFGAGLGRFDGDSSLFLAPICPLVLLTLNPMPSPYKEYFLTPWTVPLASPSCSSHIAHVHRHHLVIIFPSHVAATYNPRLELVLDAGYYFIVFHLGHTDLENLNASVALLRLLPMSPGSHVVSVGFCVSKSCGKLSILLPVRSILNNSSTLPVELAA